MEKLMRTSPFFFKQLLEHMLRPLAKIYPMEWRSVLVDFGTPPTEHLFIRVRKAYIMFFRTVPPNTDAFL